MPLYICLFVYLSRGQLKNLFINFDDGVGMGSVTSSSYVRFRQ